MSFKVGDKVRCVDGRGLPAIAALLPIGAEYVVTGVYRGFVRLGGLPGRYFTWHFELVEEPKPDVRDGKRATITSKDGKSVLVGTVLRSSYLPDRFYFNIDGPEGPRNPGNITLYASDWDFVYEKESIVLPTGKYAVIQVGEASYIKSDSGAAKWTKWTNIASGLYASHQTLKDRVDNGYEYRVVFEGE